MAGRTAAALLGLACAPWLAAASLGDSLHVFQLCVSGCLSSPACNHTAWTLGLVPWSCEDECRYLCMHEIESRSQGQPLQYYGKWPFRRFLGVQEPVSAVFSLLNGYPHLRVLGSSSRRRRYAPAGDHPAYRALLLVAAFVGVNTWWWSAVFHTRDNWLTERLDYHWATINMATFFLLAVVRLVLLISPQYVWHSLFVTCAGVLFWLSKHFWYLNFVHFDYGYNVMATGIVVVLQVLVWLTWAAAARRKGAKHWAMVCKFQAGLLVSASFEAFDFPPILGLLDAHACWHGLTIGLGFYWYRFQVLDARWRTEGKSGRKVVKEV